MFRVCFSISLRCYRKDMNVYVIRVAHGCILSPRKKLRLHTDALQGIHEQRQTWQQRPSVLIKIHEFFRSRSSWKLKLGRFGDKLCNRRIIASSRMFVALGGAIVSRATLPSAHRVPWLDCWSKGAHLTSLARTSATCGYKERNLIVPQPIMLRCSPNINRLIGSGEAINTERPLVELSSVLGTARALQGVSQNFHIGFPLRQAQIEFNKLPRLRKREQTKRCSGQRQLDSTANYCKNWFAKLEIQYSIKSSSTRELQSVRPSVDSMNLSAVCLTMDVLAEHSDVIISPSDAF